MTTLRIRLNSSYGSFRLHPMSKAMQRFYFLYKNSFLTELGYKDKCRQIDCKGFTTVHELKEALMEAGLYSHQMCGFVIKNISMDKWLMDNWSYFNPHIQRKIEVVYPLKDKRRQDGTRVMVKLI